MLAAGSRLSRYPDASQLASGTVLAQNARFAENLCGEQPFSTLPFRMAVSPPP